MATRPGGNRNRAEGQGTARFFTECAFRLGFGSEYWAPFASRPGRQIILDDFLRSTDMGRRNPHALRNSCRVGIQLRCLVAVADGRIAEALARFPGRTLSKSSVGFARRCGRGPSRKNRARLCASRGLWTFHFLSREPASPGEPKMAPSAAALERARAIGRYRRARLDDRWLGGLTPTRGATPGRMAFDTGRQIIPPAVSGRRFAGAGPRSTVRPARQACRSGAEKFRPAAPEQSFRSWRGWLRRSHGPGFATRP